MIEFGFYALWTFFYFAAAVAAAVQVSCCFLRRIENLVHVPALLEQPNSFTWKFF
jgi:hypothetical protein